MGLKVLAAKAANAILLIIRPICKTASIFYNVEVIVFSEIDGVLMLC